MKEFFKKIWEIPYVKIGVFVVVAIFVLAFVSYVANSFPRQTVLDKYLKQQEQEIVKKYEDQIAQKNGEIDSLNSQITQIQQQYDGMKSQYLKLKKEKANVQKPKDTADTVNRLRAFGYNPSVR